jgi:hypothetical protein
MKGGYRTLIFQIESFEPDVSQFKPAHPKVLPKNLFITVDFPEEFFTSPKGLPAGANCLTLKGLEELKKVLIGVKKY